MTEQFASGDKVHGVGYLEHAVADAVALQVAPLVPDVAADPVAFVHELPPHRRLEDRRALPSVLRSPASRHDTSERSFTIWMTTFLVAIWR